MEGSSAGDDSGDSDPLEGFQIWRSFVPVSPRSLCFLELNVGKTVLQLLLTAGKSVLDLLPSLPCLVVGWILSALLGWAHCLAQKVVRVPHLVSAGVSPPTPTWGPDKFIFC